MASRRAQLEVYQNSVASKFLNGNDPERAIQSVLRSKNPVGDMRQLVGLVSADADAKAGLQRAALDFIQSKSIGENRVGGQNAMHPVVFQKLVRQNRDALAELFSPEQMRSMDAVAADLQRSNLSISGNKLAGTPGTAQDLTAAHGHQPGNILQYLLFEHIGGTIGHFLSHGASYVGEAAALVGNAMRNSGLRKVDDLVAQAMLNPDLARTLLAKVPPQSAPTMARIISTQIKALAANAGVVTAERQAGPSPIPTAPGPTLRLHYPGGVTAPLYPSLLSGGTAAPSLLGSSR
jgi:hypothetical protein